MQGEYEKAMKHTHILLLHLIKFHWNSNMNYACHMKMLPHEMFSETVILQLLLQSAIPPDSTAGNASRLHGQVGREQKWHHKSAISLQLYNYSHYWSLCSFEDSSTNKKTTRTCLCTKPLKCLNSFLFMNSI